MTAFKFPPPPPPPPRASAIDNQPSYPSHRGGDNRGRGDGFRGRGGAHIRGGSNGFNGPSRGGQQASGRGNAHSRGGSRGGHQGQRGGHYQRDGANLSYERQQQHSLSAAIPDVSSTLVSSPPAAGYTQPQVGHNAFAQAMSFMATPAGAQSMAAFASHMAGATKSPYTPTAPFQQGEQPPRYSPSQQNGPKRKWDERSSGARLPPQSYSQPRPQSIPQQQGTKPPRAKAAVPPAVPTFGFSLSQSLSAHAPVSSKADGKDTRKSKLRLGLTQNSLPDESSAEEGDEDEEVVLRSKLRGGGYAFEHEGEQISLQTAADIVEWIKDRRRNFPTRQKAMEKAEAAAKKRRNELEFVRQLKEKEPRAEAPHSEKVAARTQEKSKRDEKKHKELAALRKKLHESMRKKHEPSTTVDLGLGYGSETDSGSEESSVLSESSVVSSSEESDADSNAESDSDAPPEPTSSKTAPPPVNIPPPPPPPTQVERDLGKARTCHSWRQHGRCPYGQSCKFKSSHKEERHKSLYEKLVEQELVKSDQLALDAIKFLGQNGFLG